MTVAARAPRPSPLPPGMMPRGLSRVQAANYVGIGATLFDEWAKGRNLTYQIGKRVLYDRHRLDAALDDMMDSDAENAERWRVAA